MTYCRKQAFLLFDFRVPTMLSFTFEWDRLVIYYMFINSKTRVGFYKHTFIQFQVA